MGIVNSALSRKDLFGSRLKEKEVNYYLCTYCGRKLKKRVLKRKRWLFYYYCICETTRMKKGIKMPYGFHFVKI